MNYAIGHYWESGSGGVGCYNYFGEVHHGTIEDANNMLEYVKGKSPDHDWKIFKLTEVTDEHKS
jgi:hypothetical protein